MFLKMSFRVWTGIIYKRVPRSSKSGKQLCVATPILIPLEKSFHALAGKCHSALSQDLPNLWGSQNALQDNL